MSDKRLESLMCYIFYGSHDFLHPRVGSANDTIIYTKIHVLSRPLVDSSGCKSDDYYSRVALMVAFHLLLSAGDNSVYLRTLIFTVDRGGWG